AADWGNIEENFPCLPKKINLDEESYETRQYLTQILGKIKISDIRFPKRGASNSTRKLWHNDSCELSWVKVFNKSTVI
ncbi:hypothetical protein TNIN_369271, partial [Trichonephila inaurata madagascariensis]